MAYTARFGNGRLGAVAHHCDGLARHHELPKSTDIREPDMISAADIKDQELTIIVSMMLIELALLAWAAPRFSSALRGSRALAYLQLVSRTCR